MNMTLKELESVAEASRKNNIMATCVQRKEEVVPLIKELLKCGDSVAVGGSMSLFETGVIDLLRSGEYRFLDRYQQDLSSEEKDDVLRNSLLVDVFFCSANAVTKQGELYNVDGFSNRIAPIAYGPKSVVMVVGCNKIVDDISLAVHRVKTVAAPLNARRLHRQTYCAHNGICQAADSTRCTDGCQSPDRICLNYLITSRQRIPNRIHVILVGEPLGY